MDQPTCVIDGCADLTYAKARGWCQRHYTRWRRYGDPEHRVRGEVRDGKRICLGCGQDLPVQEFRRFRVRCLPCGKANRREKYYEPWVPIVTETRKCEICGEDFGANKKRRFTCGSDECRAAHKKLRGAEYKPDIAARRAANRRWYAANRERAYVAKAAYRARKMNATTAEPFTRVEVFERDGWLCQLCNGPVDRSDDAPFGDRPSLDHIVPLSRGGAHVPENCQTAHLRCNSAKGARSLV